MATVKQLQAQIRMMREQLDIANETIDRLEKDNDKLGYQLRKQKPMVEAGEIRGNRIQEAKAAIKVMKTLVAHPPRADKYREDGSIVFNPPPHNPVSDALDELSHILV